MSIQSLPKPSQISIHLLHIKLYLNHSESSSICGEKASTKIFCSSSPLLFVSAMHSYKQLKWLDHVQSETSYYILSLIYNSEKEKKEEEEKKGLYSSDLFLIK